MDWSMVFFLVLTAAMLAVIAIDASRYIIPNTLNLFLLGLYPFAAYLLGLGWPMALVAAGITLLLGMGIFALGIMGGGDIKLLAVLVLFTGWHMATLNFLFLTAVCGGALVIVILFIRYLLPVAVRGRQLPRVFTPKQPIPYGLAIAFGFLAMLWTNAIPGFVIAL